MVLSLLGNFKLKKLLSRVKLLYRIKIKPLYLRKPIFFIYAKLGLKITTREDLLRNDKKYYIKRFGCQELVTAESPCTAGEISKEIKEILHPFTLTIDEPFVCEVLKAQLAGPAANGFDEDSSIILETTTPFHATGTGTHLIQSVSIRALCLRGLSKSSVIQLDTACSLVNAWSKNYWHWVIDSLTRLEGVEFYQKQTGVKPVIVIDSNPSAWQIDSLKLLGYEPEDCMRWNGSKIQIKKLIISSFRRHYEKEYSVESPLASRWVRQRMLSNISGYEGAPYSSKIFISRRKTFGRRVLNENDTLEALASFGFVDYVLEEMSFLDQVRLFAQAKIIVAPHGAGLTNIIFGQNLTIVELFGSSLPPCFANLARGLGFRYGCIKCQSSYTGVRRQDSDMIVDVPELSNFVIRMLEESKCQ